MLWTLLVHGIIRVRQVLMPDTWGPGVKRPTDLVGVWGKGLARIMGVRVSLRNQRRGHMGDLVIANHMGFLDIPVLLSIYPAIFVIKMEIRNVFFFGKALEHQGHVFVARGDRNSERRAAIGIRKVIRNGDRLIIFPEGKASPGAERLPFKPFSFREAARQKKHIEVCVIDYLPDRSILEWNVDEGMLPQIVRLLGRRETLVSVEFFPSEIPEDGEEAARRYQDLVQSKLHEYDGREQSRQST
jgi:1-acyl-sn-glycerol-3-phosphate acyltransferase